MSFFDFLKRKEKKEDVTRNAEPVMRNNTQIQRTHYALPVTYYQTLIRPHITERSRAMSQQGIYVFRVSDAATKPMVKKAVEALYQVAVTHVRMTRVAPKPRRRGLTRGTKKGYKKAAVVLRAGQRIEDF